MLFTKSIQQRLVLYVSLGLLVFSSIAGAVVYRLAFEHELHDAGSLERQLVRTVQAQAEVAAFAANAQIAEGVIEGLRANPRIRAARITVETPLRVNFGAGFASGAIDTSVTEYPLYSPVDGKERIGVLTVARNDAMIQAEATLHAMRQAALLILQLLASAVLIVLFSRHLISRPVIKLALALEAIKLGSGSRVSVDTQHAHDEIGSLAESANALIDAAENALAEVQALATTDVLTGLPNRRAFMARMEDELSRIKRYESSSTSIMMLDLDHFKEINDRHGHAAGDAVLRELGELIAIELRKADYAGRIGGEEFALVLPGTEGQAAAVFAERLRHKVAEKQINFGDSTLQLTVSIGVSEMRPADTRPDNSLARADQALYAAKENGRNRVEVNTKG